MCCSETVEVNEGLEKAVARLMAQANHVTDCLNQEIRLRSEYELTLPLMPHTVKASV